MQGKRLNNDLCPNILNSKEIMKLQQINNQKLFGKSNALNLTQKYDKDDATNKKTPLLGIKAFQQSFYIRKLKQKPRVKVIEKDNNKYINTGQHSYLKNSQQLFFNTKNNGYFSGNKTVMYDFLNHGKFKDNPYSNKQNMLISPKFYIHKLSNMRPIIIGENNIGSYKKYNFLENSQKNYLFTKIFLSAKNPRNI